MWKKIIVAVLVLTVAGAVVMAVVDSQAKAAAVTPVSEVSPTPDAAPQQYGAGGNGQGRQQGNNASAGAAVQQQLNQSTDNVGDPWSTSGVIVEMGDVGMTVELTDGSQIYVELGPSFYWQAQGNLAAGAAITIDGFYNGDQYHAASITTADGATLALRSETGQPLWSGGAANGASGSAGHGGQGAGGTGQVQVAPEDWVTIDATVATVNRNGLTVQTAEGETLVLSFGRATFWQEQAVQFAAGDAIEVKGFWQDGQYQTGQVTKLETGERLLLRDPNGRPLWGGPGRQGGQGGQGGHSNTTTTQVNG